MRVIVADKHGRTDGSAHNMLQQVKSTYPIVIVSWVDGFVFNDALLGLKDFVLVCFCEYGWDYKIEDSHIWGVNTKKEGYGGGRYSGEEWTKFDNWVKENQPKITLKRELLKKDVSDTLKPIEYPCLIDSWPIQTKEEFNARPISAFQYWGRSNELRLRIHAEIWLHAFNKGFQPCDNLYYVNHYMAEEKGEKWITLWIPHYARIDVNQLMLINGISKLSLSWPGAGFKCFRSCEAPVNSVLVMHRNDYVWAYDWNDSNCILVQSGDEIAGIEHALQRKDLYEVYKAGVENVDKYRLNNYISNYIEPLINNT